MKKLLVLLAALGALLLSAYPSAEAARGMDSLKGKPYAEGEVLVKFRDTADASKSLTRLQSGGLSLHKKLQSGPFAIHRLRLRQGDSVVDTVAALQSDPDVEFAEPNYLRRPSYLPDDTYFSQQWWLYNFGQILSGEYGYFSGLAGSDIDAQSAWDTERGATNPVVIAVLDTGMDLDHPDLRANIWTNPGEAGNCSDNVDNDHNGYVDDCQGWDFAANDKYVQDSNTHATHVAGIIGAQGGNGFGTSGVMQSVRIMPLRFIDDSGYGTVADEIEGLMYAARNGAEFLNASYGGSDYSQSEISAFTYLGQAGCLVLAAAGNSGYNSDVRPEYPAAYEVPYILSVAATDASDRLTSYSNFGVLSVDLAAPGDEVFSTLPSGYAIAKDEFTDGNITGWTTGGTNNTWGIDNIAGHFTLSDSPASPYIANTDSWAYSPPTDLFGETDCTVYYTVSYDLPDPGDALYIQFSTQPAVDSSWTTLATHTGTTSGSTITRMLELGTFSGLYNVAMRLRLVSDASVEGAGADLHSVEIRCKKAYGFMSGTSMATPVVAGTAGLVKSHNPSLTNLEVKDILMNSTEELPNLWGKLVSGGRINAARALLGIPKAPTNLVAVASPLGGVMLTWTDNSTDEQGFRVERFATGDKGYSIVGLTLPGATFYLDPAPAGNIYYYRVRAFTTYTRSAESNVSLVSVPDTGGDDGGGPCFIATAAYGSTMAPEVDLLRAFRDTYLKSNAPGRWIVAKYYKYSPVIAHFIAERPAARAAVRTALAPLVYGLKYPLAATMLMLMVATLAVTGHRRRRVRQNAQ